MKRYVFDSFAIIDFYADEPGADIVERLLIECATNLAKGWICVINWAEIFYSTARVKGEKVALKVIEDLERYPITIVEADKVLTWEAAKLKTKYRIAYANCFALALAKMKKAALITGILS